jgi:S1-C subfamily serine protease
MHLLKSQRHTAIRASRSLLAFAALLCGAVFAQPASEPAVVSAVEKPAPEAAPAPEKPSASKLIENSVVKVFSTLRGPDFTKPWTKSSPREVSGSGVVVEGKRILTNAHVVTYASQVQIQANGSGDKLSATVEHIAYGIDLAVLKLDDESFFDTHPAVPRASALPAVKDAVMAFGYPTGGSSLSITKGIVSRIEFSGYNNFVSGLRIQIDAAINSGNSGGPAVAGDRMIGLAFSHLGGAQNIGYIIPCEEIELFLADVADGRYDGKPGFYDDLQTLENPALRSWLKLPANAEGILVTRPDSSSDTYPLRPWDLLTRIGDTPIDNQGMIKLPSGLRLRFGYLLQKLAVDGKVPLTIIRDGQPLQVQLPVVTERSMLIAPKPGLYPSYFIYGPLVFSDVGMSFANGFFASPASTSTTLSNSLNLSLLGNPLVTRRGDKPAFPGEELVIIPSPLFPHKLSKGYGNPFGRIVESINGTKVRNLAHLVELLRDTTRDYTIIVFAGHAESFVFSHKDMLAASNDILSDIGVRSQGSPDMLSLWNGKPASK